MMLLKIIELAIMMRHAVMQQVSESTVAFRKPQNTKETEKETFELVIYGGLKTDYTTKTNVNSGYSPG